MLDSRIRLALASGSLLLGTAGIQAKQKPNVIIIYSDDQGTLDLGCYGTPDIKTPNIDALAQKGTRFTQFYAAPVSSASRASLLTGQYCKRAGETGNSGIAGLAADKETLAQRMKKGGYNTALLGKWHLGSHDMISPNRRGFDYFFGFRGGCEDSYSHFYYWWGPNVHDLWENEQEVYRPGKFLASETLAEMKNFIERQDKNDPFFIYWAINIPHYPYQPAEKWLRYYRENFPDMKKNRQHYAAFVSTMDEIIGQMTDYLREKGLNKNTIIIFQADNGYSGETPAMGGGGYCGNYRGCKFSLFEGGIRVPAIISYPGVVPQGEVRDQMVMNIDWFPTILELTGVTQEGIDTDGKNILPLIKDNSKASPHDVLFFDFLEQWAVRKGDWKLICNAWDSQDGNKTPKIEGFFLTNVREDPSERRNYADERPEIVHELDSIKQAWNASLPPKTPNPWEKKK